MGYLLLPLLTSTLLYLHSWRMADAQPSFTLKDVALAMDPGTDVARGTNLTLRCLAVVSSSGEHTLSRAYVIYKDGTVVYTKTSSSPEELLYPLPQARASNTGKYKCQVDMGDKRKSSESVKLTVTGLSTPVLHLNKGVFSEGEEVTARCSAPGETGSIIFYFYEDTREIHEERVNSNQVEAKLRFSGAGIHKLHCSYTVMITPDSVKSSPSNSVTVSVKELFIAPVLKISPQEQVFEGDQLTISCTINNSLGSSDSTLLYLSQGTRLLSHGSTRVDHNMTVMADDSGEFECRLETGNVVKDAKKTVTVTELFSVPTLVMSPTEVFPQDKMKLVCESHSFASERLRREEVTYSLEPLQAKGEAGVFSDVTRPYDLNYTCAAKAKGIMKHSNILTVRPKVPATPPKISVQGKVILGRPFQVYCLSERGSPPINYILLRDYMEVNVSTTKQTQQKAVFTVVIQQPEDIKKFMCEARNNPLKEGQLGKRLNATVIVPLSDLRMTVLPDLADVAEGDVLYLICGVTGTPPVTFKWYRVGSAQPLFTTTASEVSMDYKILGLRGEHSGVYYCEAVNQANNVLRSQRVSVEVHMALWKKGVIGASCLLVVLILVVLLVLHLRAKRGKREAAAELSVKPSSPNSDESLMSLTHDTEVYNAATDAAPHFDGTEGRVTNGMRDSLASLPADMSNRSSYSIPATV